MPLVGSKGLAERLPAVAEDALARHRGLAFHLRARARALAAGLQPLHPYQGQRGEIVHPNRATPLGQPDTGSPGTASWLHWPLTSSLQIRAAVSATW